MCMCICMCVYIRIFIRVQLRIRMCICIYAYAYACAYAYLQVYVFAAHTNLHMYIYACVCVNAAVGIYKYIYTHTYIHVHAHVHPHLVFAPSEKGMPLSLGLRSAKIPLKHHIHRTAHNGNEELTIDSAWMLRGDAFYQLYSSTCPADRLYLCSPCACQAAATTAICSSGHFSPLPLHAKIRCLSIGACAAPYSGTCS